MTNLSSPSDSFESAKDLDLDSGAAGPVRLPVEVRRAYDVVAVSLLIVGAYIARRGALPGDGLWFDDSWVATGAIYGHPQTLLTAGSGHPMFTALLMAINRVGTGSTTDLGVPSLVAGVISPALLYAALRFTRFERSVSTIVAATLVVAPIPILYSGRVKGYTLDTVLMLGLAIVVPLMAKRRWTWPTAAAWALAMIVIGGFSGYLLLASAAATAVLVFHANSDRWVRAGALVAQGLVQVAYLRIAESKTDLAGIEAVMEAEYDGHMAFSLNPLSLAKQVFTHLQRVAEVFPGGSGTVLSIAALAGVAGLVVAAIKPRTQPEALAARFLLLAMALAVTGSFADRFPFGTTNDGLAIFSAGGRHTLWLLPALAFGLASSASRGRQLLGRFDIARFGLDVVLVLGAVSLVVTQYQPAPKAPYQGSRSASRFIDANIGPNDLLIVGSTATFTYANNTNRPLRLVPTPTHQVGFAPDYRDKNVMGEGGWAARDVTDAEIVAAVKKADRVFVIVDGVLNNTMQRVDPLLKPLGFSMQTHSFEWTRVDVWRR
ncbi:MAG: hypothetical protein ABIP03_15125 [Aquihabitans sp.]